MKRPWWRLRSVGAVGAAVALALTGSPAGARLPPPASPQGLVLADRGVAAGVRALAALPGPAGQWALALGREDRVELGWVGGAWPGWWSWRVLPLPAEATVLAVADLDGSGQPDLMVGTAGAGSVVWVPEVLAGGEPRRAGGFLFGPARQLVPAQLDGVGPLELVAVNEAGELFVFASTGLQGYRRVWATSSSAVLSAAAGDLDGDGRDEVIMGSGGGAVQVLRWTGGRLEVAARGYPWGDPVAVAVPAPPTAAGPSAGAASRVVVATSRRVAYTYRLEAGSLVAEWLGGHDRLSLQWIRSAALLEEPPGTLRGVVFEGTGPEGIQLFRLDGAGVTLLGHARWPGPGTRFERLPDGVLLVLRPDGSLDRLREVSAGYLDLQVAGRSVRPSGVIWEGDVPLLPTSELVRLLRLQVRHAAQANAARVGTGEQWVWLEADHPRVVGPLASLYLPQPPVRRGEHLYVPPDVLQALGWSVRYEPPFRRLRLDPPQAAR